MYYVMIDSLSNAFYGLSTINPSLINIPSECITLEFDGDLPSDVNTWDITTRTFHTQTKPLSLTKFQDRFTPYERIAIRTLAKTDPIADDFIQILIGTPEIDLLDPLVIKGLAYLVYIGILTEERAYEIGN